MARKMLINATRPEEVRVAIVQDNMLESFEVAATESGLIKGNIYRGVVVNVRSGLEAAFVDIGTGKDALLRAEDVVASARHRKPDGNGKRQRIESILDKGKSVIVQVSRDPIAHKGAQVTTNLSLAGRYLVVMPFDDVRGVSRRTEDEDVRHAAKEKIAAMNLPDDVGVIVRTNALDQPKTALNRDLSALLRLWRKVKKEGDTGKGTKLLYSDQDLVVQALRDHLDSSIEEVLVDDDEVFAKSQGYMASFMPRAKTKLVRYADRLPLFSRFKLEEQIDRIYRRSVDLPSGGSIVIDSTEALTAIDVNSGRGTRGANQEENAVRTNVEAARAVGRQLRLRDIGGLIVVDFIDMRATKNNRLVEKTLKESMKEDKARFSTNRISSNGLLEINRQRIKKALQQRSHRACPTCAGSGTIASAESVGLGLIRRIEARAVTGDLMGARIELHPELADALQNDRRQELAAIEREFDIRIEVIAAAGLHRSEEKAEWVRRERKGAGLEPVAVAAVSAADLADGVQTGGRGSDSRDPEESGADGNPPSEGAGETPRRRRRGRRKKPAAKNEEAMQPVQEDDRQAGGGGEEQGGAADEPLKAEADRDAPADGDGDKPRRRRRGRRKKSTPSKDEAKRSVQESGPKDAGAKDQVQEGGEPVDESQKEGDEEKPAKKSSRRRRRPRRSKKPKAGADDEPKKESKQDDEAKRDKREDGSSLIDSIPPSGDPFSY